MIRLLVGLGNPGPEYEATRHNAGFWFVDAVARQAKVTLVPERSYFGLAAKMSTPHGPVWLLEPMTYMNVSGKSVAALARFFKIAPDEILVVHDELDLMPGQAKLKLGGSHAGHNGLKDIHAQLGSAEAWMEYQRGVFARTESALASGNPDDYDRIVHEDIPEQLQGSFVGVMAAPNGPIYLGDVLDGFIFQHGIRHLGEIEHARSLLGLQGVS